jgi:small subunit ribosomal protein S5
MQFLRVGKYGFATTRKELLKAFDRASQKVRAKEKVADMKKLQKFVEEKKVGKNLHVSIEKTARYNQEYRDFLADYSRKNKNAPTFIDLSRFVNNEGIIDKDAKMRREDMEFLSELRKRRSGPRLVWSKDQEMKFFASSQAEGSDESMGDLLGKKAGGEDELPSEPAPEDSDANEQLSDGKKRAEDGGSDGEGGDKYDDALKKLGFREEVENVSEDSPIPLDDMETLVLHFGTTTVVTPLQRINYFRNLVFMGNGHGIIGYGKGTALDLEDSLQQALNRCKKNLIAIPLDLRHTWPQEHLSKFGCVQITAWPSGKRNDWGHPLLGHLFSLAGIEHFGFKLIKRNINIYNLMYAFVQLVTKNSTHKDLAEATGVKVYEPMFGRRYTGRKPADEEWGRPPNYLLDEEERDGLRTVGGGDLHDSHAGDDDDE